MARETARYFLAELHWRAGRWDDAVVTAETAAAIVDETDQVWLAAFPHAVAVYALAARGEVERAGRAPAAAGGGAGWRPEAVRPGCGRAWRPLRLAESQFDAERGGHRRPLDAPVPGHWGVRRLGRGDRLPWRASFAERLAAVAPGRRPPGVDWLARRPGGHEGSPLVAADAAWPRIAVVPRRGLAAAATVRAGELDPVAGTPGRSAASGWSARAACSPPVSASGPRRAARRRRRFSAWGGAMGRGGRPRAGGRRGPPPGRLAAPDRRRASRPGAGRRPRRGPGATNREAAPSCSSASRPSSTTCRACTPSWGPVPPSWRARRSEPQVTRLSASIAAAGAPPMRVEPRRNRGPCGSFLDIRRDGDGGRRPGHVPRRRRALLRMAARSTSSRTTPTVCSDDKERDMRRLGCDGRAH